MKLIRRLFFTALVILAGIPVGTAGADILHDDDVVILFSLCVGPDCANGEVFDFDTLRLKGSVLRLALNTGDGWLMTINDTDTAGGKGFFALDYQKLGVRPFKIMAGAAASAFYIDSSGLGIGTDSPANRLHVAGGAYFSGTVEVGSSRSLKERIRHLEGSEALAALEALEPVRFRYKTAPQEETLGFIAEDVPELLTADSGKAVNPVDLIAVLTRVIQKQQETIEDLTTRIAAAENRLSEKPNPAQGGLK